MRAFEQLIAFNKANPNVKHVYKAMQEAHLKNNYADGIFFPSSATATAIPNLEGTFIANQIAFRRSMGLGAPESHEEMVVAYNTYQTLSRTFGTWRNTLGIYRIDPDIFEQSCQSPIPLDTPISIFSRLPDWCVYIEHPPIHMHTSEAGVESMLVGFWALFDIVVGKDGLPVKILSLVLDVTNRENTDFEDFISIQIVVADRLTVRQSLEMIQGIEPVFTDVEEAHSNPIDRKPSNKASTKAYSPDSKNELGMAVVLSLLLWLCAEEPDISNIKGEPITPEQMRMPKYTRHKKTGAFVPPSQPTIYEIGKRLGGEVRQFNKEYGHSDARTSSRKRPHIRRGHWHGVWKGVAQDRQFSVYWQPAIFVNTRI